MVYDIAIIGCGPAGMSAAICAKLRNKSIVLLGSTSCSRKLEQAPVVENYLGFSSIPGKALRDTFIKHLSDHDITIQTDKINSIYQGEGQFDIFSNSISYSAKSVIIATGINLIPSVKGEKEFVGRGVSYCATCDGPLYKGKNVAVISGISEGEDEANYLAEICEKVYYFPRYKGEYNLSPDIELHRDIPTEIIGDSQVRSLSSKSGKIDINAVFLIYEASPTEQLIAGLNMEEPHIKTDRLMRTNIPGVFAAGDCTGRPYQIAKAVGEGLTAALSAVDYLAKQDK